MSAHREKEEVKPNVSVVYAIFVEWVVFRELTLRKLFQITERAAVSTGVIFILLAMGGGCCGTSSRWPRC